MLLFLDSANIVQIKRWVETGIVDGVTMNPSLLLKELPSGDASELAKELVRILPNGFVNIQVTETEPQNIYKQAHKIAELGSNVVVKIPFHEQYLSTINSLVKEGVKINVTLIFSTVHAFMVAKLGVFCISPFVGRRDDVDTDGLSFLEELIVMRDNYAFESKILAASLRSVHHLNRAIVLGADMATVSPALLDSSMANPLLHAGHAKFRADWESMKIKKLI